MQRELNDYKQLQREFLEMKKTADTNVREVRRRLESMTSLEEAQCKPIRGYGGLSISPFI